MASRQILAQLNLIEVSALTDSGNGFIGFGAKADGLYLKNGAAAELRLLTSGDIGVNVASFSHTHSGFQATLSGTGLVRSTAGVISYDGSAYVTGTPWTGMGYVTGTPWTSMGYLTSITKAQVEAVLTGAISSHTHSYEPTLGNPSVNGYILSSTTAGVRSWIAPSGSYTLPLAANGTRGGVQLGFTPQNSLLAVDVSSEKLYVGLTGPSIQFALNGYVNTVGGTSIWGNGDIPFVVPNGSVTTAKMSIYGGASQGALLTYDSMYNLVWTSASTFATSGHTHSGVYEPVLGNPGTSGYVLSSTTGGSRSWIAMGSSYSLPLAANGTRGGVQLGYSNYYGTIGITLSGEQLVCVLTKGAIEYALTGNITSHTHSYAPINGSSSNAFSTANLSVTGTISASSTITGSEVYRGSSRTLKKKIADFDFDAMGFLNDVSIKRYYLKSNNSFGIGFIAEDTHPWLSGDDQKSHVFGNHLGLLTKAIQEEDLRIKELEYQFLDLQARIRELEIARANGWK